MGLPSSNRPAWAFALALGSGIIGCGHEQKSVVPLFPSRGTVTLDGKPLEGADLEFIPEGDTRGQGGAARTAADGAFTVMTPYSEPGLAAGEYRVIIRKQRATAAAKGGEPLKTDLPPIESAYDELLPPIYSDPAQSNLKATVTRDGNTAMNFELKSAGK